MLPISLDVKTVPIALIGAGEGLVDRLRRLHDAGAACVSVFADYETDVPDNLGVLAISRDAPADSELSAHRVAYVVGIEDPEKTEIALRCRRLGLLINVEDHQELCDFHSVSVVRRGDLTIAISTNGKGPALSRRMREFLEHDISPEWADRMAEIARQREELKASGLTPHEISEKLNVMMDQAGWFVGDKD